MKTNKKIEQVIKAGKELVEKKLIVRTWGNVSIRGDKEYFYITASGKDYRSLTEEEVVKVAMKDMSYKGDIKPSSEKYMHGRIYKERDHASFIVHTHQTYASALSVIPIDKVDLSEEMGSSNQIIPIAPYAISATKSLGRKVGKTAKNFTSKAILLRNHGVVCIGSSKKEAFMIADSIEEAAKKFLEKISPVIRENQEQVEEPGENKGEIWNKDALVMAYAKQKTGLLPYLDDFTQLIGFQAPYVTEPIEGVAAQIVEGKGVLCRGKDREEAEAISTLIRKNCLCYFAAAAYGIPKPLSKIDTFIMNVAYASKYSKLKDEK